MRSLTVSTKDLTNLPINVLKIIIKFHKTKLKYFFLYCSGLLIIYWVRRKFDRFSIIDMNENIVEKFTLLI